jgi:SH3-like domain-containing protein
MVYFQGGKMKRRVLLLGFVSTLLVACAIATPAPAATHTPTATFSPTFTPTSTPTATPIRVTLIVKDTLVNCRFGPGITYALINELKLGESARVVGRNESSTWWYVRDPGNPNGYCWVSADVTETQGVVEELPMIQPPVAIVTGVSLRVEPSRIVVNCDQFPQTIFLEAEVTSNGPAFVTWRWEASTGVSSSDAILVFEESGTQVINDYYQIAAPNEYWINLHILAPNEWVEQVKFPVSCTP